ncbi:MAG: glycine cleavage system protein H, partial [Synergistaceae bacterium]|nr:glycine cleavage system protein H [Synergistaceae bacterium]
DINSPVSGVITKINNEVIENPGIINIAPFDEGWLIEIEPENISEFDALMDSGEYKKFISK